MQVTVIGGGVVGCFASYYLLKKGHSVKLVDDGFSAVKTSYYNAGSINAPPSFTSIGLSKVVYAYLGKKGPVYVSLRQILRHPIWYSRAVRAGSNPYNDLITALSKMSLSMYDDFLSSEKPEVDFTKGGMMLYNSAASAEEKAKSIGGRFVDSKEAAELGFKGFGGGVFYDIRHLNPHRLCSYLLDRISAMGADITIGKEVHLKRNGSRVSTVVVDDEKFAADAYILAAGAWSNRLCRPLGYNPQIMPARGMVQLYEAGGSKPFDCPATMEDEGVAVVPHGNSTVRLTSFFELVGHDYRFNKVREDWLLNAMLVHKARPATMRLVEKGVGFRPCTPDQIPVVGKIPECDNAYIAAGGCRKGLTLAPIMSHIVTSIMSGEEVDPEIGSRLSPTRF